MKLLSAQKKSEQGVGHVLPILVMVVLVAITFVGYRVLKGQDKNTTPVSSQQATKAKTAAPQTINSGKDLNQAQSAVNSSNVDSDLNPNQMDSDVNSLL